MTNPTPARPATAADIPELVRLRGVMLGAIDALLPPPDGPPAPWQDAAVAVLRDRLGGPALAAYVVDRAGGGLASCAVGVIEQRLGGPRRPTGEVGYVFNVVTDPDTRRRGHARACLTALLAWFDGRGISTVDLRASPDGDALYRSLGFAESGAVGLRRSR